MKYIKILSTTFILGFSALAFADNCSYEVRGYDMSEGMLKVAFEDSFDDQDIQATPTECVAKAVTSLKSFEVVTFEVKGKTFSSWPAGLHVIIEITNMKTTEIDVINNWVQSDPSLKLKQAFEHGTEDFTADIGFVRQIAEAKK